MHICLHFRRVSKVRQIFDLESFERNDVITSKIELPSAKGIFTRYIQWSHIGFIFDKSKMI